MRNNDSSTNNKEHKQPIHSPLTKCEAALLLVHIGPSGMITALLFPGLRSVNMYGLVPAQKRKLIRVADTCSVALHNGVHCS